MNKILTLLFSILLISFSKAQDYKFSQFYNAPLALNPALTGKIASLYRVGINYRMQNSSVQSPPPFSTFAASGDFGLFREKLLGDIVGVGAILISDNQASGALKTIHAYASGAYHKSLGINKNHFLSAGFQLGIIQRRVDLSSLSFESQFTGTGFDIALANQENFSSPSYVRFNMNTGLFWTSNFNASFSAFGGVGLFNLTKPNESFFSADNERSLRLTSQAGVSYDIKRKVLISPNILFMTQNSAVQITGGSTVAINLSGYRKPYQKTVFAGLWYDANGAIITSLGAQYLGVQATISYDATVSKLRVANNGFGALEFSLIYTGKSVGNRDGSYQLMHCPRF